MSILKGCAICTRYVAGFVLMLAAATAINVAVVLGWSYFGPDSFNRTLTAAVEASNSDGGEALLRTSALALSASQPSSE